VNPALGLANRTLDREVWARDKLAAHAGRTLRVRVGPASALLTITADGTLESGRGSPDFTLTIPFRRVPALLAQPERFAELVDAEGDASLAATLADLAIALPWLAEQALSAALGPIVGVRLADAGRQLLMLPGHAAQSIGTSIASYASDEAHLVLSPASHDAFVADVRSMAQRVEALASRVDALEPSDTAADSRDS